MRRIRSDLWETRVDSPFAGLTTHAYLWTPPSGANVLLYSVATPDELDALAARGGVAHQYLSHRDEAGPMLRTIAERFGAVLHASALEVDEVGRFRAPDVRWHERHVDGNGIEVVPTPGHSPGSTCFVVPGADGERYLFTGDTLYRGASGRWHPGYLRGISDAGALASSLDVLAGLEPDLVVSSAFAGDAGAHTVEPGTWPALVEAARAELPVPA